MCPKYHFNYLTLLICTWLYKSNSTKCYYYSATHIVSSHREKPFYQMSPKIIFFVTLRNTFVISNMLSCLPHGEVVLEPFKDMSDITNLFGLWPADLNCNYSDQSLTVQCWETWKLGSILGCIVKLDKRVKK